MVTATGYYGYRYRLVGSHEETENYFKHLNMVQHPTSPSQAIAMYPQNTFLNWWGINPHLIDFHASTLRLPIRPWEHTVRNGSPTRSLPLLWVPQRGLNVIS